MAIPEGNTWHPIAWESRVFQYKHGPGYTPVIGDPVYLDATGGLNRHSTLMTPSGNTDAFPQYDFSTDKLVGFVIGTSANDDQLYESGTNVISSAKRLFMFRASNGTNLIKPTNAWMGQLVSLIKHSSTVLVAGRLCGTDNKPYAHGVVRNILPPSVDDGNDTGWILVELKDDVTLP